MQNKTVIVIAHRLSTIKSMDRILVFDKGSVVEEGTHEYLLEKGNIYPGLWKTQQGFLRNLSM
jgi:ABC-type multidrug transport system fused ATPase/permease subunit